MPTSRASAATAVAMLSLVESTDACAKANHAGATLRSQFNLALKSLNVPWAVYGEYSAFHIFTNPEGRSVTPTLFDPHSIPPAELRKQNPTVNTQLKIALLNQGVEINAIWPGGLTSAAHTDPDIETTTVAFRKALLALRNDGTIA